MYNHQYIFNIVLNVKIKCFNIRKIKYLEVKSNSKRLYKSYENYSKDLNKWMCCIHGYDCVRDVTSPRHALDVMKSS